jgi:hypothetical protein
VASEGPLLYQAHVLPAEGLPSPRHRYDRLAANFLGSIHLAAVITWWL